MGFDAKKIIVGAAFYVLAVMLPTVNLLFAHFDVHSTILERVAIGVLGVVTAGLVWEGIRGEPAIEVGKAPTYFGFNALPIAAGAVLLYLAWVSNVPASLGGKVDGGLFVVMDDDVVHLGTAWGRIIASAFTYAGILVLAKWGFRTEKTPEERRQSRLQRRAEKQARRAGTM